MFCIHLFFFFFFTFKPLGEIHLFFSVYITFWFNFDCILYHLSWSFLLLAKWPNRHGAIWTLEISLHGRVMATFLKLGNWPPHESVERYLLCFHCPIRPCMNFFHLLAYWAKFSLNAKVFIMAVESVLARGHPWCSTGCLGKTGIRKLPQSQATATNCAEWLQSPL